jgi:hypothetical protein
MNTFHILTVIVAVVFFIILFAYTIIIHYFYTRPMDFPMDMTSCPDYWNIDPSGNCIIPDFSSKNIGGLAKSKEYKLYEYKYEHTKNSNEKSETTVVGTTLGVNFLKDYNDYTPGTNNKLHKKTSNPLSRFEYRYDISNNIPAGYDVSGNVINFKDPQWSLYSLKQIGDPYCGIGTWCQQNNIQWDSINAYYKNKCK